MPGMDGIEMAKAAARRFPRLRILLIPAMPTSASGRRPRGIVVDVLQKPFTLTEIRDRVASVLASSSLTV